MTGERAGRGATRGPARPGGSARWVGVAATVLAVIAGTVVTLISGPGDAGVGGTAAAGDIGHVHALAVDPATGVLHAATHHGLYRVDGADAAVRVSTHAPDLMGFTTVGPGHFVASGHPDPHARGPANLGLIESNDGGVTWNTIALSGAADFHGLHAAHDTLYGYNSTDGAFMASTDRRVWEHRSLTVIGAFTVSPSRPDEVLAVGRNGLQRSPDGGRSWQLLPGTPSLAVLTWDTDQELFGVDADGGVWQSSDGGVTWQRRGDADAPPHALTRHGAKLYLAVAGERIIASTDGGATWSTHYQPA